MILLSASRVWLGFQRDGGIWSFPTWTKNRSSLHRQPEVSLDVVEETLLILQESQLDPPLELVAAVSRWMFSVPDLLQVFWFVHLRLENKFSSFFGKNHLFRIESLRIDFRCVHSNSSMSAMQQNMLPFQILPRTMRIQGTIQVRLSFQTDGFLTDLSQK